MKDNKDEEQELMEEEYIEETDNKVHGLIYNIVGFISCLFFMIMFGGIGILAIFQEDIDSTTKIVAGLFGFYAIFIGYKAFLFAKSMIDIISNMKKRKKIVITIRNIGYFIYSLPLLTILSLFIIGFVNPKHDLLNGNYRHFFIMIVLEAVIGTVLIYVDAIMKSLHKNTTIIEIDKEKENK